MTGEQKTDIPQSRSEIALPTDWGDATPASIWDGAPRGAWGRTRSRMRAGLGRALPAPLYGAVRQGYRRSRSVLGRSPGHGRLLPDFLVIGVAKGGTTTLCAWLYSHPFVAPAARKEVHYFDYQYFLGEDWYRANFPRLRDRDVFEREHGRPFLTGEASPTYISHQWAPGRIAEVLPHAKLIVAVRNPVDRAYSQFQMSRRADKEPLETFEDAVAAEEKRLRPELERVAADPSLYSGRLGVWSYLLRSRYAEQLERWFELFPREQFHFVKSEELAATPGDALAGVQRFLGLPDYEPDEYPRFHVGSYEPMAPATREMLAEYFRPHNERLYDLVGIDFGWESDTPTHSASIAG